MVVVMMMTRACVQLWMVWACPCTRTAYCTLHTAYCTLLWWLVVGCVLAGCWTFTLQVRPQPTRRDEQCKKSHKAQSMLSMSSMSSMSSIAWLALQLSIGRAVHLHLEVHDEQQRRACRAGEQCVQNMEWRGTGHRCSPFCRRRRCSLCHPVIVVICGDHSESWSLRDVIAARSSPHPDIRTALPPFRILTPLGQVNSCKTRLPSPPSFPSFYSCFSHWT